MYFNCKRMASTAVLSFM